MPPHGPPFDFDLNEPPPPEDDDDGVDGISVAPVPAEPSAQQQDPLPPAPAPVLEPTTAHVPLPARSLALEPVLQLSAQQDPLPPAPAPVPEPATAHVPLPARSLALEPVLQLSAQQDPLPPAPAPVPEPETAHVPLPARSLAREPVPQLSAQQDPLPPAPVPEPTTAHVPLPARSLAPVLKASPDERLPPSPPRRAPVALVPSPSPRHPPSPVLDLEAPLSSLDDEDEDEADLPPPPPLPLPPPPPLPPWYRVDTYSDALTVSSARQGDNAAREYSSPETWAPRGSMAASDTTSSHRSQRSRPYSCDDAISKHRRVDYDEDGGSSRSGGRDRGRGSEFGSPRRYERSGPAPSRRRYYEQDGGRRAPATDGQPGAPSRNRRRRRAQPQRPLHGYQYQGPVQKQQVSGWDRGPERPQDHHGPRGPEVTKVGYASRRDSSGVRPRSPEQEPGHGWYHRQSREKDAPPFRPSSRPDGGREDSYHGRQSQAQDPPKIGGFQHREREAPSFRPSSGARGRDGLSLSGGRHIPEEKTITGGAHHQQAKAPPRGRDEHFPDRSYHPYARHGGDFDRSDGGRNPARREPRDSYEHRRYSKQQLRSGEPARGRQYYGDVQE